MNAGRNDESGREQVTRLLNAPREDRASSEQLLALVYEQLRAIARQRMADERREHTLQATALVHEAYLRLVGEGEMRWASRAQFFHAAGEAMRRILVEHARAKGRVKRGGGQRRVPLSVVDLAAESDLDEILALDEAIRRLENEEPDLAGVIRLRFFAGLSVEETAESLGVSPRQVNLLWYYARARLFRLMEGGM